MVVLEDGRSTIVKFVMHISFISFELVWIYDHKSSPPLISHHTYLYLYFLAMFNVHDRTRDTTFIWRIDVIDLPTEAFRILRFRSQTESSRASLVSKSESRNSNLRPALCPHSQTTTTMSESSTPTPAPSAAPSASTVPPNIAPGPLGDSRKPELGEAVPEPKEITDHEVGEYREQDRYLPVRTLLSSHLGAEEIRC